jgi:hypothetical protein
MGWDGKGGRRGARTHDAPHASDEAAHPGGEGPAGQQHSIRPGPVRGTGGRSVPRRRRPAGDATNPSPTRAGPPTARGEAGREESEWDSAVDAGVGLGLGGGFS